MTRSFRSGYPSHRQVPMNVPVGPHVLLTDSAPRPPRVEPWITTGSWTGTPPSISFPPGEYLGVPTYDYYYLGVCYLLAAPTLGTDITRHGVPNWSTHVDYITPPLHDSDDTHDWVTFAWFSRVGHYSDSEVQIPTQSRTVGGVTSTLPVVSGVYMLVKIPDIAFQGAAVLGGSASWSSNVNAGEFRSISYSFTTASNERVVILGTCHDIDILDFEESPPMATGLPLKLFFSYTPEGQTINASGRAYYGSTETSNVEVGRYAGDVVVRGRRITVDSNTVGPALPDRESVVASPGPVRLHRF